jgi:hypothetical protein
LSISVVQLPLCPELPLQDSDEANCSGTRSPDLRSKPVLQLHAIDPVAATFDSPKSAEVNYGVPADLNKLIVAEPAQHLG